MRASLIASILLAIAASAGCVKTHAQRPDPPSPLAAPEPPNRVIIPAVLPDPVEPAPAPTPPPPTPNRPPATSSRPPDRPAAAPAAPAPAPAAPEPASPPVVLQTTSAPGELDKQTRLQINTAKQNLDRINAKQLNSNAKAQYDMARGFIRQAEQALNAKNFLLARDLADKAAVLAKELAR